MIKVTVWNENAHEKEMPEVAKLYPKGIHGAIADFLSPNEDMLVRTATQDSPDQGLPDELVARYEGLDKKSSRALALELSVQMARRMAPLVDGYYLMTPLGNVRIMEKLIAAIRQG